MFHGNKPDTYPNKPYPKMKKNMKATLILLLAQLSLPVVATASDEIQPGWNGQYEHLEFNLTWLFVPGGIAIIQAEPIDHRNNTVFHIQACTNPTLDLIHKVRDSIRTTAKVDQMNYRSLKYRFKQQEGRRRQDLEIAFQNNNRLEVKDNKLKETKQYQVPENTIDLVTAFFKSRSLALEVGKSYDIPVFDKNKQYVLKIEVLEENFIKTIFGNETDTVVIRPKMESEGIFARKGEVRIWLTNDEKRIPVRMETKVKIGKIVAELAKIQTNSSIQALSTKACEQDISNQLATKN